ncbi:MAG: nucleoside deaminase [Oscillospiraceae bacterium]|jgi:tRNA(adenine34) deaminase|nr:nucleoside deaminase [Oscillospiraceae bacterium]
MDHEIYMRLALALAQEAAAAGEVPVGCVIADESGAVVGSGRNTREAVRSALGHAELSAIDAACRARNDWRLDGCTLYVTLEPCPMCAGAIINARIPRVVFGAREPSLGSCVSVIDLFSERYGHRPAVYAGVLESDCAALVRGFFERLRA